MKKLILRIVFLITIASAALAAEPKNNDEAVINEFSTRVKEIQQRVLATSDLEEAKKATQEIMQLFEALLPKLSPEVRPMMKVSFQVVAPLQQRSSEYLGEASKFFASDDANFTSLTAREQIAPRVEKLTRLLKLNDELLAAINNLDADVGRILDDGKVTGANRAGFLQGFNESTGRTIGPMRAIRTLDTQILTRLRAAFQLLEKHWGKWSAKAEGTIVWQDAVIEAEFTKLQTEVQELAERQATAQQQLSQRL